jgi:hypothetical protein
VPFFLPTLGKKKREEGVAVRVLGSVLVFVLGFVLVLVLVLVLLLVLVSELELALVLVLVFVLLVVFVVVGVAALGRVFGPGLMLLLVLVLVLALVFGVELVVAHVFVPVLSVVFVSVSSSSSLKEYKESHTEQGSCPLTGVPQFVHGVVLEVSFWGGEGVANMLSRLSSPRVFLFLGWGGGVGGLPCPERKLGLTVSTFTLLLKSSWLWGGEGRVTGMEGFSTVEGPISSPPQKPARESATPLTRSLGS